MTSKQTFAGKGAPQAREHIDSEWKWKLVDMYASDDEWEKDFAHVERLLEELESFRGTLGESAQTLLRWLRFADNLNILMGKVGSYAYRRYDEDTTNPTYQALTDRVRSQHAKLSASTAWVVPELLHIPEQRVQEFLDAEKALALYEHHLDEILRMKPFTLAPREEELLALSLEATSAPATLFSMFNDADIRFGSIVDEDGNDVEVTKGRYIQLQESTDRRVRHDAYAALYGAYSAWRNTLAGMLNAQIKREIFYSRARGYESTQHMALFEDNIPGEVYDNVISTVNESLKPLHRAMELRRSLLGLDTVRPWDLYVPLLPEAHVSVGWEEACSMVEQALHVLGPDYSRDLGQGLHGGWVDVYENIGKASGAYSAWTYGSHPFVLMNYTNTLKDMFTLAHEMGHSMHSYYTWKHQPPVYGGYTIFCAEVASTCNEVLLVHHLLAERPERELQLQLLLHYIDTIRGTVYNQALFAEFEQHVHREAEAGHPLTVAIMNEIMRELYIRYYGPAFGMDDDFAMNWSRIPHFYRSFYVFQYVTGLSAAVAIVESLLSGGEEALQRYLAFLKSGSSRYSMDLLRDAGVDMSGREAIAATARLMDTLLDRVESLL